MSEPVWVCFVCGKPVSDDIVHQCHRDGCKQDCCDCDYPCHPGCCPDDNQIDKREVKMSTKLDVTEWVERLPLNELRRMYLFTLGLLSTHKQFSDKTPTEVYTYLRSAFLEMEAREGKENE
jgi:hypothetical protein